MPHSARWTCFQCNRLLGRVHGVTLAVEDARVLVTPGGVVVSCPTCKAERTWTPRPTRAA